MAKRELVELASDDGGRFVKLTKQAVSPLKSSPPILKTGKDRSDPSLQQDITDNATGSYNAYELEGYIPRRAEGDRVYAVVYHRIDENAYRRALEEQKKLGQGGRPVGVTF